MWRSADAPAAGCDGHVTGPADMILCRRGPALGSRPAAYCLLARWSLSHQTDRLVGMVNALPDASGLDTATELGKPRGAATELLVTPTRVQGFCRLRKRCDNRGIASAYRSGMFRRHARSADRCLRISVCGQLRRGISLDAGTGCCTWMSMICIDYIL